MASWLLPHSPWSLSRLRVRWDAFTRSVTATASLYSPVIPKNYYSTPSASETSPYLNAIRKQPYPYLGLNLDIFEDTLGDYGANETAYPEVQAARAPCGLLAQLVRDRSFDDAELVYRDLMNVGVEIKPDPVYHVMAYHVLRSPLPSGHSVNEQTLEDFVRWFKLVPSANDPAADGLELKHVMHHVFNQQSIPNIPLASQFLLISAAKGYKSAVEKIGGAFMVRYAPPSVSLAFLKEFRDADEQFFNAGVGGGEKVNPMRYANLYSLAIRTYCMTGRFNVAADVFQDAASQGITIDNFTIKFAMQYLAGQIEANSSQTDQDVQEQSPTRQDSQDRTR